MQKLQIKFVFVFGYSTSIVQAWGALKQRSSKGFKIEVIKRDIRLE